MAYFFTPDEMWTPKNKSISISTPINMTSRNIIKFSYNWKLFASGIVIFSALAFMSHVLPQEHIVLHSRVENPADAWEKLTQITLKLIEFLYNDFLIHITSFINQWLYPAIIVSVIAIAVRFAAKLVVWTAQLGGIIINITNTIVLFIAGDRTITVAAPEFEVD